jgi:hypothetical protein
MLREAGLLDRLKVGGVEELAQPLNLHPALVAGMIRKELGDYSMLAKMVGARVCPDRSII